MEKNYAGKSGIQINYNGTKIKQQIFKGPSVIYAFSYENSNSLKKKKSKNSSFPPPHYSN